MNARFRFLRGFGIGALRIESPGPGAAIPAFASPRGLPPLLTLLWVLVATPTAVQAQFATTVNPDGTLTIAKYECTGEAAIIPETLDGRRVTAIGDYAFFWCMSLTSVEIPQSVTRIGTCAFQHCWNLRSARIPDRVDRIGPSAFGYCRPLAEVTIPRGVTDIGPGTFESCTSLRNIVIPPGACSS